MNEKSQSDRLEERLIEFAARIIRFAEELSKKANFSSSRMPHAIDVYYVNLVRSVGLAGPGARLWRYFPGWPGIRLPTLIERELVNSPACFQSPGALFAPSCANWTS